MVRYGAFKLFTIMESSYAAVALVLSLLKIEHFLRLSVNY